MVTARARVLVTLEIQLNSTWGGDCPFEQVQKQAVDDAIHVLRRGVLFGDGLTASPSRPDTLATVIGTPKVTAVLVEAERP